VIRFPEVTIERIVSHLASDPSRRKHACHNKRRDTGFPSPSMKILADDSRSFIWDWFSGFFLNQWAGFD
jgi:hypothetical protein